MQHGSQCKPNVLSSGLSIHLTRESTCLMPYMYLLSHMCRCNGLVTTRLASLPEIPRASSNLNRPLYMALKACSPLSMLIGISTWSQTKRPRHQIIKAVHLRSPLRKSSCCLSSRVNSIQSTTPSRSVSWSSGSFNFASAPTVPCLCARSDTCT